MVICVSGCILDESETINSENESFLCMCMADGELMESRELKLYTHSQ